MSPYLPSVNTPALINPSNAEATYDQTRRIQRFETHLNPVMFIHYSLNSSRWVNSQISTLVPGFQSMFRFFASFCNDQISHQQHRVNPSHLERVGWAIGIIFWHSLYIIFSALYTHQCSFPRAENDTPHDRIFIPLACLLGNLRLWIIS